MSKKKSYYKEKEIIDLRANPSTPGAYLFPEKNKCENIKTKNKH